LISAAPGCWTRPSAARLRWPVMVFQVVVAVTLEEEAVVIREVAAATPEEVAVTREVAVATRAAVAAFPVEVAAVRVATVAYPGAREVIRAAARLGRRMEPKIRGSLC